MSDFHALKVYEVIQETEDCVTVLFEVSEDLKDQFKFKAGQYLTIKAMIDGEEVRRAYSICTGQNEKHLGVSVKRVEGGKMSNYLNSSVKKGDILDVMKPDGKFTLITHIDTQRDHYFFAAGSGITPVMSMIKSMLEDEPKSTAYLLYGSKHEEGIIFKSQIEELQNRYEGQFIVQHTLSKPTKEKSGGILGILGKKETKWTGLKGRIDSAKVARFAQEYTPKSEQAEYYICGPGSMIETVQTTLMGNGVQKQNIHREYFTAGNSDSIQTVQSSDGAVLTARLNGEEIKLNVVGGKTLLDTLLDAGHEAPYSCTSGACSSCMAKVIKGEVKMEACFALDDDEVEEGYILTCQAHPISSEVEIEYEG
ncbi:MAG: ferredoxin--NADP reductase [Saprospiraceae bacterium]|nr:ferredoxin--NADP reductase [Saprospiraceae bacterium]